MLLALSLLLIGVTYGLSYKGIVEKPSFINETVILLALSTGGIYAYLIKKPAYFIQLYLLTMVVKLLAFATYTFLIVLYDQKGAGLNVVFFMISYFLFTALEVIFLYRRITK